MVISLLLGLCVAFTLFFGKNLIYRKADSEEVKNYKGIINVWQIDSFEGGTGSRKNFLSDMARTFEKKNDGVLVMVSSHTAESAEESFKKGVYPDLISYGYGVEITGIIELKTEKDFDGGKVGDKQFAVPWCRGNYVLIENPEAKGENTVVSESKYTLPEVCAAINELNLSNCVYEEPLTAYITFVGGKAKYLIGTQRDIVRLENRGFNYKATPLFKFNDLYQYISAFNNGDEKSYFAKKYLSMLLSDETQKKLSKIRMFSCFTSVEYEGVFNEMQKETAEKMPSVFMEKHMVNELKSFGKNYLSGEKNVKDKIEKMLL